MIDLRSDTVTQPNDVMRKIMAEAPVGDDVFHEDPSINELEAYSAELSGKEAAIFISSGTMGNLLAAAILAPRGTEVLMHEKAHTFSHELSGISAVGGCKPVPVPSSNGIITAKDIEPLINTGANYYDELSSLIIIENTHNFCGGTYWRPEELQDVASLAQQYNLPVHMDGARVFNAQVASGISLQEMGRHVTSLTFCLSKGLGAPVGSMLCGSRDFIRQARRLRKMLGGGMRQAGIVAAAGLYALKNNVNRLKNDHDHAHIIAQAFNETGWAKVSPMPQTNIVFANTTKPAAEVVKKLAGQGIICLATGPQQLRMVTHINLTENDVNQTCSAVKQLY